MEGRPHHTPRGSRTRLSGLPTGHRARPHTTDRAWMLCPSLHRTSGGQSTSSGLPAESAPLVFFLHDGHGIHGMFTPLPRICRKCRGRLFLKAVWLSLSFVPDDGDGHTAFFVRCRGERSVFLGGSNHSPKTPSLLSFVLPCPCRPGHLIVPTAKVSHARLAASVFMQHL